MNNDTLSQLFAHYIENFEYVNSGDRIEYYKWQICYSFHDLMDAALAAPTEEFAKALLKAEKCSGNIIDSFTTPFNGLVKFAEEEPETVRQMFKDLYAEDNGDLTVRMKKIEAFFLQSKLLLDKYSPGSHMFAQNSHSVSSYLFLYDPDHYYMYKAKECKTLADCIGFYDDWGTGDNIKLDVFYRMCDWVLEEIKKCPELLDTDASRFDGRLKIRPGKLHADTEKHILLFDIIWVCMAYGMFNAIPYKTPTTKERKLYVEKKEKAKELKASFDAVSARAELLNEAKEYFASAVSVGDKVIHKAKGECEVEQINREYIYIKIPGTDEVKKLGLSVVIVNGIIRYDLPEFAEKLTQYKAVLQSGKGIETSLEHAAKALAEYEEYLD